MLTLHSFFTVSTIFCGRQSVSLSGNFFNSFNLSPPINEVHSKPFYLHSMKWCATAPDCFEQFFTMLPSLIFLLGRLSILSCFAAARIKLRINTSVTLSIRCSSSGIQWSKLMWISGFSNLPLLISLQISVVKSSSSVSNNTSIVLCWKSFIVLLILDLW